MKLHAELLPLLPLRRLFGCFAGGRAAIRLDRTRRNPELRAHSISALGATTVERDAACRHRDGRCLA